MSVRRAGCKINLGLRITGKRPDGYHELETLFYPLALPCDELRFYPQKGASLRLDCLNCQIAGENLVTRVWREFCAASGQSLGLRVELLKRIPAGAGLGGGSSDAAATLAWLNDFAGKPLSDKDLAGLAAKIGADVPFFLLNRPAMARGIGERLEPVAFQARGRGLALVCPEIQSDTARAFKAWDLTTPESAAKKAISADNLHNDLERPVFARWPQLARLKADLLELGAEGAAMSGSGSSIYGIFAEHEAARAAAAILRRRWRRVYCLRLEDFGM